MGGVVLVGSQTIVKCAAAAAETLDNSIFHQKVECPVNGDPIDMVVTDENLEDFLGIERPVVAADHFQNQQSMGSGLQPGVFKQLVVVAMVAHGGYTFTVHRPS